MNKKQFTYLWVLVQTFLFLTPIVICLWYVPYDISYDKKYVAEVNRRAFENSGNNKITDFKDAKIAENDAEGKYVKKVWYLENKELYYFQAIIAGILIGALLQMFNAVWWMIGDSKYNDY